MGLEPLNSWLILAISSAIFWYGHHFSENEKCLTDVDLVASINLLTPPWNPILWIFEYHWQKYITTNYTEFLFYWDFPPQLLRFSTKGLFHQGAFPPRGFFTKGLFHQGAFPPMRSPTNFANRSLKKCLVSLPLFGQTSFLKQS